MHKSQFPADFEFVGAEVSEEEDQFYKYRTKLASIFRSILAVSVTQAPILQYLQQVFSDIFQNFGGYSVA
jgi:hypothetical protein